MTKSRYDPSRDTIGKIYRDLQIKGDKSPILTGDMTHEMQKSLVDDVNDGIVKGILELGGEHPFFITVHEKKDAQMPKCLLRRIIRTTYRPWPEDDTIVFKHYPRTGETRFCWCLPHSSEMDNMLASVGLFDADLIRQIKAWKAFDLYYFGFCKDEMGNWMENPNFIDKKMEPNKRVA